MDQLIIDAHLKIDNGNLNNENVVVVGSSFDEGKGKIL